MRFRPGTLLLLPLVGLTPGCPQWTGDDFVKDSADEAADEAVTGGKLVNYGSVTLTTGSDEGSGGAGGTDATSADSESSGTSDSESSRTSDGGSGDASESSTDTAGGTHQGGATASAGDSGGAGGGGTVGTMGGSGDGGSSGGVGSSDATGSGTSGAEEVFGCSDKRTLTQPLLTDFEAYDGITPPLQFQFPFSASGGTVSVELVNYSDETGDYTLSFGAGAHDSSTAVIAANPAASDWGGGVSLRVHCIDASGFRGIEFMARGVTPATTVDLALVIDDNESFSYQFEIGPTWKRYAIEFTQFRLGSRRPNLTTTGDGITGIVWSSQLDYSEVSPGVWEAEAGAFELNVDDVGFLE